MGIKNLEIASHSVAIYTFTYKYSKKVPAQKITPTRKFPEDIFQNGIFIPFDIRWMHSRIPRITK